MNTRIASNPRLRFAGVLLALLLVAAGIYTLPPTIWLWNRRICPNTYIETVDVGGLGRDAAVARLRRELRVPPLRLVASPRTWHFPLTSCGGVACFEESVEEAMQIGRAGNPFVNRWEVWRTWFNGEYLKLQFRFDEARLRKTLRVIARGINRPPQNARIRLVNGFVYVQEGKWGYRLDEEESLRRVKHGFGMNTDTIPLAVRQMAPRVTAAELQQIDTVIASFSTRFNPRLRNRTHNIHLACAELNGRVVAPGEIFSFNGVVGKRTFARGYRMAKIFDHREVVDGIGGGVCQISTTLYNCVRRLRFPIIERHHHSLPVPYIRHGLDATVSFPYRDFKFKNHLSAPIAIWTEIKGNKLIVYILGSSSAHGQQMNTGGASLVEAARWRE